jgi:hypothetical protein
LNINGAGYLQKTIIVVQVISDLIRGCFLVKNKNKKRGGKFMLKWFFCIVLVVSMGTGVAGATLVSDTVALGPTSNFEGYVSHGRGDVNFLDGIGDFVAWEHTFNVAPNAQDATLEISFRDDDSDSWRPSSWELAIFVGESAQILVTVGEVNTGVWTTSIDPSFLSDGIFQAVIWSVWGDLYVDSATLSFESVPVAPVPEPATMLLFGAGLSLFGIVRRKQS